MIINKPSLENYLSMGVLALKRASAVSKQTTVKYLTQKQELAFAEGVELHGSTLKSLCLSCLRFSSWYNN